MAIGFAVLAGLIVLWNASAYPAGAGYDAPSHREYADFLIQHLRLPVRNETPEYYSPPLYYAVAGAVTWIGRQAGLGEPHKLGQLLNVADGRRHGAARDRARAAALAASGAGSRRRPRDSSRSRRC